MSIVAALPDLAAIVRQAEPADLPRLAGLLAEARAVLTQRLVEGRPIHDAGGTTQAGAVVDAWLTPEQAAGIAKVPVRRIYGWARGQRWASRPSRRCLRVEEAGFRRWLHLRT